MPFIQLDDQITEHPKILKAGGTAAWVWVTAIAYCQRQLTDGFIGDAAVCRLAEETTPKLLDKLVTVGLLDRVDGGYQVHDYLTHNPSKETVLRRRAESAARKSHSRATRDGRGSHSVTDAGQARESHVPRVGAGAGPSGRIPTPTPTPTPEIEEETQTAPVARLVSSSSTAGGMGSTHIAAQELVSMWNQHRRASIVYADLQPESKRVLRTALQAKSLDTWEDIFRHIEGSDYLAGRLELRAIGLFDAIAKADLIAEGKYDNRPEKVDPKARERAEQDAIFERVMGRAVSE